MEIAIGIAVAALLFYFFRQARPVPVGETSVNGQPHQGSSSVSPLEGAPRAASSAENPATTVRGVAAASVTTLVPAVPQEHTLRRHFVTHVQYMLETVNPPRPTEHSLSRHYDQLLNSQLEKCLSDSTFLEKVIGNYDCQKKAA